MRIRIPLILAGCMVLFMSSSASSVESDFNGGFDYWLTDSPTEIAWNATGGNPGGYVHFEDLDATPSNLIAPEKFLGNWSALDGVGVISFDHKIFYWNVNVHGVPYRVYLDGPGGEAEWSGPTPTNQTDWTTFDVPIQEGTAGQGVWVVHSGTWQDILANVTRLRVKIEVVSGGPEQCGLDNIILTPVPPEQGCIRKPVGDINNDCIVNLIDLALLAANWMDCGYANPDDCS